MPQASLATALQNINLKMTIKGIYKSKINFLNKVVVPHYWHSTLIVRYLA